VLGWGEVVLGGKDKNSEKTVTLSQKNKKYGKNRLINP
jgi:hypothetical protein